MRHHQKERQEAEQTAATNERLLAAFDEIELLREQVESWHGLVERLNLELRHKEQQLQEAEQELKYTNHELPTALMLKKLELDEAKELAKIIVESQNSVSESLAEVLSAIYGSLVKPEELEQINKSSITTKSLKGVRGIGLLLNQRNLALIHQS